MKTAPVKIFAIAFISTNVVLAAAAMPDFVRDRIVDKIMDWGDKHIGGPFKKGGGDEEATRKVFEDFVSPGNPWEAAWDISTNGESHTATPEQDTPDPSHLAPGAHLQIPIGQPNQIQNPTQPPISVNLETAGTPPTQSPNGQQQPSQPQNSQAQAQPSHDHSTPGPPSGDHAATETPASANSGPSSASQGASTNQGNSGVPPAKSETKWLVAGEKNLAQADSNKQITVNPPETIGGSSGQPAPSAPQSAPVASTPAPAPAPAPAPPAPPARTSGFGPSGHSDPMGGAHEINGGRDKPDHNTPGGRDVSGIS